MFALSEKGLSQCKSILSTISRRTRFQQESTAAMQQVDYLDTEFTNNNNVTPDLHF
jgi:hypothetical protein